MEQPWKVRCALAAIALVAAACNDTTDPEPEPDISTMRITIGSGGGVQTVNVSANCAVSAPIALTMNTTTPVAVVFLNAAGQPDPIANDASVFRLAGDADVAGGPEPAPNPSTIVWARTGSFAGTLRGSASTLTGSVALSAFHLEEGHADYGCAVPVQVSP